MGSTPQVLHRSARAITTSEFYDALMATCAPRFPGVRGTFAQRVVLAVSGGVDSMALAYLCQKVRKKYLNLRISDNTLAVFHGIVVDHGLRQGSHEEAKKVVKALQNHLGLTSEVYTITWKDDNGAAINPHALTNFETVARQRRYNRIGGACVQRHAVSFFTAHNEDDQYETVLMRLLSGHGYRGLQGMHAATDIPECYEKFGVYQSGYVDDQMRASPIYNTRPTGSQTKRIRRDLKDRIDPAVLARELLTGSKSDPTNLYQHEFDGIATGSRRAPKLAPMHIEDGGIMLYRPLLSFSKDRLIATCLENNVPWFEDKTNHDPTFTMRNAVRHMCKNYQLPVALQKPAVLDFSRRCKDKVTRQKAETNRLFKRTTIHDFEPNVGTAVVELPRFSFAQTPRRSSPARRQKRTEHYRVIAALLIRRLLSLVTPERELTPIKNLDYLVSLLFPYLSTPETKAPLPPKPYVICGVHFTPLVGNYSPRWLLSRAPYPSNIPRPKLQMSNLHFDNRYGRLQKSWPWRGWSPWELYDGRYWTRLRHRLPFAVRIAPFGPEHHKPFREGLADPETKTILSLMLKRYAPGKVRYTLPAIYVMGNIDNLLKGQDYWARYNHFWHKRKSSPVDQEGQQADNKTSDGEGGESTEMKPWQRIRLLELQAPQTENPVLVALPTLGIALPGIQDWIDWEIRYRKVDIDMVTQSRRFWIGSRGIEHRSARCRPARPLALFRAFRGVKLRRSSATYRAGVVRPRCRRGAESVRRLSGQSRSQYPGQYQYQNRRRDD
ncbi:hypothetical protein V8F33_007456 [Rhypophila sp. PSN 637]